MPQLGETVTEGTITRWFKQVGESIAADEPLFEVSTDKVDSEVPAPTAGVISEILVPEGDTVPVGARLAVISDGAAAPAPAPAAAAPEPAPRNLRRRPNPGPTSRRAAAHPLRPNRPRPVAAAPAAAEPAASGTRPACRAGTRARRVERRWDRHVTARPPDDRRAGSRSRADPRHR